MVNSRYELCIFDYVLNSIACYDSKPCTSCMFNLPYRKTNIRSNLRENKSMPCHHIYLILFFFLLLTFHFNLFIWHGFFLLLVVDCWIVAHKLKIEKTDCSSSSKWKIKKLTQSSKCVMMKWQSVVLGWTKNSNCCFFFAHVPALKVEYVRCSLQRKKYFAEQEKLSEQIIASKH